MEYPQYSMVDPLTHRESEVLILIAKGLSNREIGEELVLSVKTVENHVHHILSKLGIPNRKRAIALAFRRGLVSRELNEIIHD